MPLLLGRNFHSSLCRSVSPPPPHSSTHLLKPVPEHSSELACSSLKNCSVFFYELCKTGVSLPLFFSPTRQQLSNSTSCLNVEIENQWRESNLACPKITKASHLSIVQNPVSHPNHRYLLLAASIGLASPCWPQDSRRLRLAQDGMTLEKSAGGLGLYMSHGGNHTKRQQQQQATSHYG